MMQYDFKRQIKTNLINQILPLADKHLLQSHTSRVVYDRCSLSSMSNEDLSEVLTFLEGLDAPDLETSQLLAEQLKDCICDSEHIVEHITLFDVEPAGITDGEAYSK